MKLAAVHSAFFCDKCIKGRSRFSIYVINSIRATYVFHFPWAISLSFSPSCLGVASLALPLPGDSWSPIGFRLGRAHITQFVAYPLGSTLQFPGHSAGEGRGEGRGEGATCLTLMQLVWNIANTSYARNMTDSTAIHVWLMAIPVHYSIQIQIQGETSALMNIERFVRHVRHNRISIAGHSWLPLNGIKRANNELIKPKMPNWFSFTILERYHRQIYQGGRYQGSRFQR